MDNAKLEREGAHYLDEEEDEFGYSSKQRVYYPPQEEGQSFGDEVGEDLKKVGKFIAGTSRKVKNSVVEAWDESGVKIKETYKDIKESEKTQSAKLKLFAFGRKVKGLFSKKEREMN